jgi:hypothetical protein
MAFRAHGVDGVHVDQGRSEGRYNSIKATIRKNLAESYNIAEITGNTAVFSWNWPGLGRRTLNSDHCELIHNA